MFRHVVCWNRATEAVYDVIRGQMPRIGPWSRSRATPGRNGMHRSATWIS